MEHSNLPWATFKHNGKIRIIDADKMCVTGEDEIIMRSDAKFIIEACNNYERLLAENKAWETNYNNLTAEYEELSSIATQQAEIIAKYQRAEIEALEGVK